MLDLLAARRFAPLFVTQFLGAFNDNLFKTAMLFAIVYEVMAADPQRAAAAATAATGLFVLPFVLFSGLAGDIADKRDKAAVARWVKVAELGFMAAGALGLWLGSLPLLYAVLFLMGVHSTVFGPVKYAILPQHLAPGELLAGTGLVEGATFVAILLGQVAGGLLGAKAAGLAAIAVAVIGLVAARFIPPAPAQRPGASIEWNPWTSSRRALAGNFADPPVRAATLAISWFWAVGAIWTVQFVPLARNLLGGSEAVATSFLAAFSIGIALGSAGVARLLKGRITARLAAPALAVMALAATDFWFAVHAAPPLPDPAALLAHPAGWRILADLLLLSVAGGVFSVPLYGVLQTEGAAGARASTIAANNIVNSGFQVAAVVLIGALIARGLDVPLALLATGVSGLLLIPLIRRMP